MPDPMTPPRAFVAGEPSGPWKVQGCNTTPYAAGVIGPPLTPYWLAYDSRQPAEACAPMLKLATREQADAVAAALNALEPDHA